MLQQWLAAGLVLIALAVLILGLRVSRRRFGWQPETIRKLLHIGMGSIALTFPWIFTSPLPVFVLAAVAFVMMLGVRHVAFLKAQLGGVIDAVDRASAGELYFPAGIALSFWLTAGDPLLYSVPILILTLADAVAALVGVRYGSARYTTLDGSKSVQGSLAFFSMAFVCTLLPLTLYAHTRVPQALLIALILGVLTMLVEAIAWRGLDNLLIPVLGFLLLDSFVKQGVAELAASLGAIVTLVVVGFLYRSRSTLADDALLTCVFIGYVLWALGGIAWVYPPLVIFLRDKLLGYSAFGPGIRRHNVQSMLTIGVPGIVWLVVANVTNRPGLFFFPYVLNFAVQLAVLELTRLIHRSPAAPRLRPFIAAVGVGWLMFIPYVLIMRFAQPWLLLTVATVAPIALGTGIFMLIQHGLEDCPRDLPRWLRQGASSLAASAAGLLPLLFLGSTYG